MTLFNRQPIRTLILAEDPLTLRGLEAILDPDPSLQVIPVASLEQLPANLASADVLLWDPGWDGPRSAAPELLSMLVELAADAMPVVALAAEAGPAAEIRALGVTCVLSRDAPLERLTAGLWAAAAGLQVLDPALLREPAATPAPLMLPEPLTPREQEVLALLAEGLTNRAIGRRLGISENTAKFHVQAVLTKLGVSSRTEAVVQASRLGLLTL